MKWARDPSNSRAAKRFVRLLRSELGGHLESLRRRYRATSVDIEDIIQQLLLTLLSKEAKLLKRYDPERCPAKGYIMKIAQKVVSGLSEYRRGARQRHLRADLEETSNRPRTAPDPAAQEEWLHMHILAERCVEVIDREFPGGVLEFTSGNLSDSQRKRKERIRKKLKQMRDGGAGG